MFTRSRHLLFYLLSCCVLFYACMDEGIEAEEFSYESLLPEGFPMPDLPSDNIPTAAGIALGKKLFYDPILSVDSTRSCASCHKQSNAFADAVSFSEGVMGRKTSRNSPSLANVAYQQKLLREGGLSTLEMQVLVPVQEHNEFDFNLLSAARRLNLQPAYVKMAQEAYGRNPDEYVITRALASFQRSLLSGDAPYHLYLLRNQPSAISDEAKRGMELFFGNKMKCGSCHSGWLLTSQAYANNGLKAVYEDTGKMRLTGRPEDEGVFKIPSLINVALTAPYMYDGSLPSLEAVIEHYAKGGSGHINQHADIRGFFVSDQEKKDLLAFLHSLTDKKFISNPDYQKP